MPIQLPPKVRKLQKKALADGLERYGTWRDFGEAIGISHATLHLAYVGKRNLGPQAVWAVCAHVPGYTPSELRPDIFV